MKYFIHANMRILSQVELGNVPGEQEEPPQEICNFSLMSKIGHSPITLILYLLDRIKLSGILFTTRREGAMFLWQFVRNTREHGKCAFFNYDFS